VNSTLQRWPPVLVLPPVLLVDGWLGDKPGQDVDALGVVVTYIAVLPLLWRTQLSFAVMGPLLTAGVALVLWQYIPGNSLVAIPAWGLYELARQRGRRETMVAAIALPPLVLITIVPFEHELQMIASLVFTNLAICELALAVGYLTWKTRQAAEAYLKYMYTDEAQEIAAKHHYRPSNAVILKKHAERFPDIRLFPVTDIARDIAAAHKEFIGEGGVFDNIYKPKQ